MRPRRRRAGGNDDTSAPSCPVCHQRLPSVKNMDPFDHEMMLLKHITRCSSTASSSSGAKKRPPIPETTREETNLKMPMPTPAFITPTNTIGTLDDSDASPISSPMSSQEDLMDIQPLFDLTTKEPEATTSMGNNPKLGGSLRQLTSTTDTELSTISSPIGKRRAHNSVASRVEKKLAAQHAPATAAQVSSQHAPATAAHCPVCSMAFPRMAFFSDNDYEKRVLDHVLACSGDAKTRNVASTKAPPAKNPPSKIKVEPKKKRKKQVRKNGAETGSIVSDCSSFTDGSKSMTISEPGKKNRVISDPRHFLMQTWWKPQKSKRTVPTVAFNLQQCVVVNTKENDVEGEPKTRGSRRLQSKNSSTAPGLKLGCPICGREFAPGWMGSITEESMSRHVKKCTHKMFSTGIDGSVLFQTGNDNADGSNGGRSSMSRGKRRRLLSEQERKDRQNADADRANSMSRIMSGQAKQVLGDMFLDSCF